MEQERDYTEETLVSPPEILSIPETELVDRNKSRFVAFSDESVRDPKKMVYEKSNRLVMSYHDLSSNAQGLLSAALVMLRDVRWVLTPEEFSSGPLISASIKQVGQVMGYDVTSENKSFYRAIRNAAKELRAGSSFLIENPGESFFDAVGIIDRVTYNPDNDGRIYFKFGSGSMQYCLGDRNKGDYTLYSMILRNRINQAGKAAAVSLHEILYSEAYKLEDNGGHVQMRIDYVDLRASLDLIRVNDKNVRRILENPAYQNYKTNEKVAYERLCEIDGLDEPLRKAIQDYKKSEEYTGRMKLDKEERRKVNEKLSAMEANIRCAYSDAYSFRKRVLIPAQKVFVDNIAKAPNLLTYMFEFKMCNYKSKTIAIMFDLYTIERYREKQASTGVQMTLEDIVPGMCQHVAHPVVEDVKVEAEEPSGRSPAARSRSKKESLETTIARLEEYLAGVNFPYKFSALDMVNLSKRANFEALREKMELMMEQYQKGNRHAEPVKWLSAAIRDDYKPSRSGKDGAPRNAFHDFKQNSYNYEELLEKLKVN